MVSGEWFLEIGISKGYCNIRVGAVG